MAFGQFSTMNADRMGFEPMVLDLNTTVFKTVTLNRSVTRPPFGCFLRLGRLCMVFLAQPNNWRSHKLSRSRDLGLEQKWITCAIIFECVAQVVFFEALLN